MNPLPQHDTQLTRPGLPQGPMTDGGWALAVPPMMGRPGRAGSSSDEEESQPLKKVHRLLRGRYKLAVSLSLAMALGLAAAGYMLPKPEYRSDGLIQIKPNIPKLDDTSTVMPLYTQHVESQVAMVLSQRVVTQAMESEEWRPYSKGMSPDAMKEFIERLEVEYVRGTFLIRVSFIDRNPDRAQAAVGAVIRGYEQLYGDADSRDLKPRLQYVGDTLVQIQANKKRLEDQLIEESSKYGTASLGDLLSARMKAMLDLHQQREEARLQLHSAETILAQGTGKAGDKGGAADGGAAGLILAAAGGGGATTQPAGGVEGLSYVQLAKFDPRIHDYINKEQFAVDQLESLRASFGPNHPRVKQAEEQLATSRGRLEAFADEIRAQHANTPILADGRTAGLPNVTPQLAEQLKQKVAFLTDQLVDAETEVKRIGGVNTEIDRIRNELKNLEDKHAEQIRIQDQLKVQLALSAETVVQSYGDKPVIPAVDRRKQAAVLGFLGGGALPFVFFMLVGLSDKRYRYSDETKTEMGSVPLLGILPNLPDLLTDPQQAAIAAHCVHQIRTLLQVGVRTHDRHVYAITSAAPGDGKTSLTLALGLSFAASGSRTLLIDCDLVGGSLTRRLGVHSAEGMLEAMGSRSPMDYVRETDVADLSILPVGAATMLSAGSFSPTGLRRLVAEARKHYDIVLIDTGPILGSIEAPPVAATADATILCVSRGQQRPAVERSMHHLLAIGVKMAGIVFNRAEDRDFEKSVSRFSQRSIRATGPDARPAGSGANGKGSLGLPSAKANPEQKAATASAAVATGVAVDPVTRAVQSDFKGDNVNDPR